MTRRLRKWFAKLELAEVETEKRFWVSRLTPFPLSTRSTRLAKLAAAQSPWFFEAGCLVPRNYCYYSARSLSIGIVPCFSIRE